MRQGAPASRETHRPKRQATAWRPGRWRCAPLLAILLCASPALAGPHLQNPSGRERDEEGRPIGWEKFRWAPPPGSLGLPSSTYFGWRQTFGDLPDPYQHVAFGLVVHGEYPGAQPRVQVEWLDAAGATVSRDDVFTSSPPTLGDGGRSVAAAFRVPPGAESGCLHLGTHPAAAWLNHTLEERIATDGLPRAAQAGMGGRLPAGTSRRTFAAAGRGRLQYFIEGEAEASGPGHLAVDEAAAVFDPEIHDAISARRVVPLAQGISRFAVPTLATSDRMSGAAEISFTAIGTDITLRRISRGFTSVEPAHLWIGDAPEPPLVEVIAAWPGRLGSATATIEDAAGVAHDLGAPERFGSTARWLVEAPDAAPGDAVVRVRLRSILGYEAETTHTLRIDRAPASEARDPFAGYALGAWIFVRFREEPDAIGTALRLAREDGYTWAFVGCSEEQLHAVREAAERHALPVVVGTFGGSQLFPKLHAAPEAIAAEYVARARAAYAPMLGSPMFLGTQVTDEPPAAQFPGLGRINRALAAAGDLGLAMTCVELLEPHGAALDVTAEPVVFTNHYPFLASRRDGETTEILRLAAMLNARVREAAAHGKPVHFVAQAHALAGADAARPVPPEWHRAQLGAAVIAGARGVMGFMHNSSGDIEGLRRPDWSPSPWHAEHAAFNARIAREGATLMRLGAPEMVAAPFPLAVSVAADDAGTSHVLLLNADGTAPATATLEFAGGTRRIDLAPGEWRVLPSPGSALLRVSAEYHPAPEPPRIPLPITHAFTAVGEDNTRLRIDRLSLSPDGRMVALSNERWFRFQRPGIYRLDEGGLVTALGGPRRWGAEGTVLLGDGNFATLGDRIGAGVHSMGQLAGEPWRDIRGLTGGARDVLLGSEGMAVAAHYAGTYRFSGRDMSMERVLAGDGEHERLFRIGGELYALESGYGVRRLARDPEKDPRAFCEVPRASAQSALSAAGDLAIACHQRGVSVLRRAEDGGLDVVATSGSTDATSVAWIGPRLLAVGEGADTVHLLAWDGAVLESAGAIALPVEGPRYIRAMAAEAGVLAVALQDASVLVFDARSLTE